MLKKTFLGAAMMATQLFGAPATDAIPTQSASRAFDQALPVTPAQKEVDRLFRQISANSAVAGRHAEQLESFTRGSHRLAYSTHASELTALKEAVNAMGRDFRALQVLRASALPWQQQLIDRMEPVLVGLASHATDAITRLNEDRRMPHSPRYRNSVENLYSYSGQVNRLIAVNLDYAQAREKLDRLDAPAVEVTAETAPVKVRSLEQRVRGELLKLPYYGVFDYLAFRIDGGRVTLSGNVSWPALKTDAERAIHGIEGVRSVHSEIQVLPLSPNDDRIRLQAYRAIYGHTALQRYGLDPNPPIRIIVDNGNVTLMGVVSSEMDRTIANMQANRVPGAFSVTNNLEVGI